MAGTERELAFTSRTVEYGVACLWFITITQNCDYIERYDAGWIVDPDEAQIRQVAREILNNPVQVP